MAKLNSQFIFENELAFFGAITASISHELNNVLSIINEYSGLLNDLILVSNNDKPIDKDRIQKIALNIAEQIKRKKSIIKLLNRFSHRVDCPVVEFNLNDLLSDITRLSQRFASLEKVNLEIQLPDEQINLTGNPFSIQHVIFLCLNLALEFSGANDSISISLEKDIKGAIINITSPPMENDGFTDKKMNFLLKNIEKLGGEIEHISNNNNSQTLKLYLPFVSPNSLKNCMEDSSDDN